MAKVVLFQPRSERNAEQNVSAFIALCRNELTIFGAELAFDEMAWEIADSVRIKAKRGAFRAIFSSWESVNERVPRPMPEPFGSFAKSYLRYQHGMRPTKCIGFRLASLRARLYWKIRGLVTSHLSLRRPLIERLYSSGPSSAHLRAIESVHNWRCLRRSLMTIA